MTIVPMISRKLRPSSIVVFVNNGRPEDAAVLLRVLFAMKDAANAFINPVPETPSGE